jgi:phenol hydroxylase P1 protein
MQIDIKTNQVQPLRHTFAHVARRLGADKPASRYQEATLDVQAESNFHYRPLWDPDHDLFDTGRTAICMSDWYTFRDPRQYYYGSWTIARSRQQESMERNFNFVEKRELLESLEPEWRARVAAVLIPLRHYEYGANLNNCHVAAYGYGTAITQTAAFACADRLGMAQYLTRIGLILDGNRSGVLESAKAAWQEDPAWQPLRRLMEELLVTQDWFEIYVAQNFVLDGLLYPLIYQCFDGELARHGGSALAMLTEFMSDWHGEQNRCVDAFLKTAAGESEENRDLMGGWVQSWSERAGEALFPLACTALGEAGVTVVEELRAGLAGRAEKKCGLDLQAPGRSGK